MCDVHSLRAGVGDHDEPDDTTSEEEPSARRRFLIGIGLITFVGFVIRVTYFLAYARFEVPLADAKYFYYWGAVQLARGHGFLSFATLTYDYPIPGAHHPPGFIIFLAGLYKLGLHSPNQMRLALCAIGSITIVVVGLLLARIVSKRAGLIGAGICAIYPSIWINDTLLMSETLAILAFALGLFAIYSFLRFPTFGRIVGAAVAFTVAAMVRAEVAPFVPLVFIPLVLGRRRLSIRRRISLLASAAVFPVLCFGAWFVYNSSRFSEPVYLSTGGGPTALAGACDPVFYGPLIGSISIPCTAGVDGVTNPELSSKRALSPDQFRATAIAYDRYLARHGDLPPATWDTRLKPSAKYQDESILNDRAMRKWKAYVSANRDQIPSVVLARELRLVGLWNPSQENHVDSYGGRGPMVLVKTSQWVSWLLMAAAIAGAILWRRRRIPLYPLFGEIALTIVMTAAVFSLTRYRVLVDVCIVLLAATAIDHAVRRLRASRWPQRGSAPP